MEKKRSNIVKKFRICLIGPSYVGKSQIVNRIVSNSFSGFYEPTISPNEFRIGYNINENNKDLDPQYFDIELIDLFPLDHPLLNMNRQITNPSSLAMNETMKSMIQKSYDDPFQIDVNNGIHAYIFVYDFSNYKTFKSLVQMMKKIQQIERQTKKKENLQEKKSKMFFPKKIVLANKNDLKVNIYAGIITKEDLQEVNDLFPGIKISEVSALMNLDIQEVFKSLINELDNDKNLTKSQIENYKQMKSMNSKKGDDESTIENSKRLSIRKDNINQAPQGIFACFGARESLSDEENIADDIYEDSLEDKSEEDQSGERPRLLLEECDGEEQKRENEQFMQNQMYLMGSSSQKKTKNDEQCHIY